MHACLSFGKNGMIFPMIRWKDTLEKLILLKFIFWLQTKNYVDLVTLTGGWPGTWFKLLNISRTHLFTTWNTWIKQKLKNCTNKLTISYVPTNIYKWLKAKNSKQVGIGKDTVGPSEPIATSEWVQNVVCLQKVINRGTKFVPKYNRGTKMQPFQPPT